MSYGYGTSFDAEKNGVFSSSTQDSRPQRECSRVFDSSTTYVSAVTTQKSRTRFKWILNDYTLLEKFYVENPQSSKFQLTNTDKQCELIFVNDKLMINLSLKVPRDITCEVLQICFSIIGENDEKVAHSRILAIPPKHGENPYVLYKAAMIESMQVFDNMKYLVNDALTLLCEVIIVEKVNVPEIDVHYSNFAQNDKNTLQKHDGYYDDKTFFDIAFFVKGEQFRAHKKILAAASPVFKVMFQPGTLEKTGNSVWITDIDAVIFEKFLKYLYVGEVENLDKFVVDLLIVAWKYEVSDLMDLCENIAINTMDISNAVVRLLVGYQHSLPKLKNKAAQFLRSKIL